MCIRQFQNAIKSTILYLSQDKRRTASIGTCGLIIFVILSLYYKDHLESQLHQTSSFPLQHYTEKLGNDVTAEEEYRYRFARSRGKRFHPGEWSRHHLGFPLQSFESLGTLQWDDFVFLTAASDSFLTGLMFMLQSVQKYFPKKKVIVYDLGLSSESRQKVTFCIVCLFNNNFYGTVQFQNIN